MSAATTDSPHKNSSPDTAKHQAASLHSIHPEYQLLCTDGVNQLLSLMHTAQWNVVSTDHDVTVSRTQYSIHSFPAFKGIGFIKTPPIVCFTFLSESNYKQQYDPIFERAVMLEEVDCSTKVEHHTYWSPPFIAKRDFVMLGHRCRLQTNNNSTHTTDEKLEEECQADDDFFHASYIIMGRSITHLSCPPIAGRLRAECLIGGYLIEPVWEAELKDGKNSKSELNCKNSDKLKEPYSRVTYVAWTDLKGTLPGPIRAALGVKQPQLIDRVRPLLEKVKWQEKIDDFKHVFKQLPVHRIQTIPATCSK